MVTYQNNPDMNHNEPLAVYTQTNCCTEIHVHRIDEFLLHSFVFDTVFRDYSMVLLMLWH